MEHRCGTRYATDIGVYISTPTGGSPSPGRLREISVSGGFIATVRPTQPTSSIILDLRQVYPVKLPAQIIRCTDDGMAVEWLEHGPELMLSFRLPFYDVASRRLSI